MKIDKYYRIARLWPAILTSIPILVFVTKVVHPIYHDSLEQVMSVLPLVATTTLSAALIFLLVQVNRFISKEVFQRIYFKEDIHMPTTDYLLWQTSFLVSETKTMIRDKIQRLYRLDLPDRTAEQSDTLRARHLVVHAVSQIKHNLKDNDALRRHNIEYGFMRNLIGGALQAVLFALIVAVYGYVQKDHTLLKTGIILLVIYSLPVLLSRLVMNRFGRYYAKVLYEQFLTI